MCEWDGESWARVCLCGVQISLRWRLCLILHFTCAIFCFEKPLLLPAACQSSAPPRPLPAAPPFAAANWQQLVAAATLFAQLPMKMFDNCAICFMHEQSCTYIWTPVCLCVCSPINVCGHVRVRVCGWERVWACVCLLAITTIANWQQNIAIAIAAPKWW